MCGGGIGGPRRRRATAAAAALTALLAGKAGGLLRQRRQRGCQVARRPLPLPLPLRGALSGAAARWRALEPRQVDPGQLLQQPGQALGVGGRRLRRPCLGQPAAAQACRRAAAGSRARRLLLLLLLWGSWRFGLQRVESQCQAPAASSTALLPAAAGAGGGRGAGTARCVGRCGSRRATGWSAFGFDQLT